MAEFDTLLKKIRACTLCAGSLPEGAKPILQASRTAKILIAGHAPGRRAHATGVPFDDASGDRLRSWLDLPESIFYDESLVAIVPMGFCYPGTGKNGDMPPNKACAENWRDPLMKQLPDITLTILLGAYAQAWHLPDSNKKGVTETVRHWRSYIGKGMLPLPHPSPRNNIWLKRNPWFEQECLPELQQRVSESLSA